MIGTEVDGGIPLKVTLVSGTCEVETVVIVGVVAYGTILVRERAGTLEVGMTTYSEVMCGDRRSSSLVSGSQEGLIVSREVFCDTCKRDSSPSSKPTIARLIRSLIKSACCTSSSSCSSGTKSISSLSSFDRS